MSNTAMKLPAEGAPPSGGKTPESNLREQLDRELHNRLIDIAQDSGAGRVKVSAPVMKCAARLAQLMIGYSKPLPSTLNIACSDDGEIIFTLYGVLDRQADLWVGSEDGSFGFVATERGQVAGEETMRIEHCWKVANWICGR